ncbi:MAG: zinc ribbon domain-containing protein [Candidatus Limnocylindrales bacterium]
MEETNRICPWCSTPIPASATACPKCGALVEGAIAKDIPGLTVVDPKAKLGGGQGLVPDSVDPKTWFTAGHDEAPVNPEAILPPSEAVRLEMRKIELEAQIENAGSELMNPTGGESIDAGPPSEEAIAAHEAGLLDKTGPAGETDLGELAAPWEDPELEKQMSQLKDPDQDPK